MWGDGRVVPLLALVMSIAMLGCAPQAPDSVVERSARFDAVTQLPEPVLDGDSSLETAMKRRRSVREFTSRAVSLEIVGQLLWAGQGITDDAGHRTAPSAGARYPIELYAITAESVLHYLPEGHAVERRDDDRVLEQLADMSFGQEFVADAPLVIAIVAEPSRTEAEYGAVAEALVDREAGHVAQNLLLQATALDLASVPVGGFEPGRVGELLALPPGQDVRYLIPVG